MKLYEIVRRKRWDIGIARISEGHLWNSPNWKFHVVKPPKGCWYADPFILEITSKHIVLLVEEYSYNIGRGRIARISIDKETYKIVDSEIVLDLNTHLSFPNILRLNGNIYIYPENSESGNLYMYEYDILSHKLDAKQLMCPLPLTDAVRSDLFGTPVIFSTQLPIQNKNVVSIYRFECSSNKYEHLQDVVLEDNTARSAGNIFVSNNLIVRPAQNCNNGYGCGLVFQSIEQNENGDFMFREIIRQAPPRKYEGMHTYNQLDDYVVVDLHKSIHPLIHKFLKKVKHLSFLDKVNTKLRK